MVALFNPQVPVEKMAEELAESQSDRKAEAYDPKRSIYRPMRGEDGYKDPPHSVYFYYIRVNWDGRLEVDHYFYPHVEPGGDPGEPGDWKPIPHTDKALRDIITTLAKNARPGPRPRPGQQRRVRNPPKGRSRFENIEWEHKSYIVFFVDEVNWKFCKPPNADPVVFITEGKRRKFGKPNWSFFDAMEFDIQMPIDGTSDTDTRTAIAFINHMKADDHGRDIGRDAQGKPLPGTYPKETQLFQFQMYLEVLFSDGSSGMTVILDPDGNNLGPPIGPP